MAIVYLLNTYNLNLNTDLLNLVEEKRKQRIIKSTNEKTKKELLGAGLLLKDTLNNLGLNQFEIIYNENNKPIIKDSDIYFSLSHSNYVVALIVSNQPIGLDIQYIEPIKKGLEKNVLTSEELNIYNKLKEKDRLDYFYQVFTAKEAFVKKNGASITIKPSSIELKEDVYTKRINFFHNNFMIACCGSDGFSIIERVISKETGEIH